MIDDCPKCKAPGRIRSIDEEVHLECDHCGVTIKRPPLVFPNGKRWDQGSYLLPTFWTRPLTEVELLEKKLDRLNKMEAANLRRGQKLPRELVAERDELTERLQRERGMVPP